MKYQIMFSGKSKNNITNMPSAELALLVVKVKMIILGMLLNSKS